MSIINKNFKYNNYYVFIPLVTLTKLLKKEFSSKLP